jgi:hypothetical protein
LLALNLFVAKSIHCGSAATNDDPQISRQYLSADFTDDTDYKTKIKSKFCLKNLRLLRNLRINDLSFGFYDFRQCFDTQAG